MTSIHLEPPVCWSCKTVLVEDEGFMRCPGCGKRFGEDPGWSGDEDEPQPLDEDANTTK